MKDEEKGIEAPSFLPEDEATALRAAPKRTRGSTFWDAVAAGKTAFIPIPRGDRMAYINTYNTAKNALRRRGLRMRGRTLERKGVFGFVIWAIGKDD